MNSFNKYRDDLEKKLHEPGLFNDTLGKLEAKTNVPRVYMVLAVASLAALYLVFGYCAELACNFVGFAYPCYRSFKAVESTDKNDDTQWLTYWVVFAVFNLLEFASDFIVGWFPLYWLAKCIVLLYLYLPMTMGAQKMYTSYLRPIFQRYEGVIDRKLKTASDKTKEKIGDLLAEEAKKH